jgi:hypothetical protein
MTEQAEMAKKRKASSLDTPASNLVITLLIILTAAWRSRRETAVSNNNNVESYKLPSHQFKVPVVLI